MRQTLIGLAVLGLLAAVPDAATAQRTPERNIPPRVVPRFLPPDSGSFGRIPPDSLRRLLAQQLRARAADLTCPMPVSRPDSLATVPIPRARLTPNSAVPIPVDRTGCRNPLWMRERER